MFKIMNGEPTALETLVPTLDPTLCSIVNRSLARDPERRYPSAVALAGILSSRLVAYDEEHASLRPQARAPQRRWMLAGLAACVPLGIALGWGQGTSDAMQAGSAVPSEHPRAEPIAAATPCIATSVDPESLPSPGPASAPAPASAPPGAVHVRKGSIQPAPRSVRPTLPSLDQKNPYE
jgi:hypothetical protein